MTFCNDQIVAVKFVSRSCVKTLSVNSDKTVKKKKEKSYLFEIQYIRIN